MPRCWAGAGIPSVLFGPGGAGLHSTEEYVVVDDVIACRDALATLALAVARRRVGGRRQMKRGQPPGSRGELASLCPWHGRGRLYAVLRRTRRCVVSR